MKQLALLVLVLCSFGCKSPREKHEEAARVHLAALPTLLEPAKSAPPTDEASAKALASVSGFTLRYLDSNALLIHLEELENPTLRRQLPLRLNHRSPTVDLAEALKVVKPEAGVALETGYSPGLDTETNMNDVWQRMGDLRFVLVVRTRELRDAALTGDKTFEAGAWEGEVLVFELATRKLLGGFPLGGTNHQNVKTATGRNTQNLAADLMLATRGNLDASVSKLIPGVRDRDQAN